MPKYTGQQIELIEAMAVSLEHFAPAQAYNNDMGTAISGNSAQL